MKLFMLKNTKTGLWYKVSNFSSNWVEYVRATVWQTYSEARSYIDILDYLAEKYHIPDYNHVRIMEFEIHEKNGIIA